MWSPEAVAFLRELQANNDREWFTTNRKRYDTALVQPALELSNKLGHLGAARILRPYRDTRFAPGRPIREQLGLTLAVPAGSYYVELSLDGLLVGAGLHHALPDQLDRFRAAIADEPRAEAFEAALEHASRAGLKAIEPSLKRAPKGLPKRSPATRSAADEALDRLPPPSSRPGAAHERLRYDGRARARGSSAAGGLAHPRSRPDDATAPSVKHV